MTENADKTWETWKIQGCFLFSSWELQPGKWKKKNTEQNQAKKQINWKNSEASWAWRLQTHHTWGSADADLSPGVTGCRPPHLASESPLAEIIKLNSIYAHFHEKQITPVSVALNFIRFNISHLRTPFQICLERLLRIVWDAETKKGLANQVGSEYKHDKSKKLLGREREGKTVSWNQEGEKK